MFSFLFGKGAEKNEAYFSNSKMCLVPLGHPGIKCVPLTASLLLSFLSNTKILLIIWAPVSGSQELEKLTLGIVWDTGNEATAGWLALLQHLIGACGPWLELQAWVWWP